MRFGAFNIARVARSLGNVTPSHTKWPFLGSRWSLGSLLGVSWEALGSVLGASWGVLERPGSVLARLGGLQGRLGYQDEL